MALNLRSIAEANWQGFALPCASTTRCFRPLTHSPQGEAPIGDGVIQAHIKLKANVDEQPLAHWAYHMIKIWLADQQGIIARRGNTHHLYTPAQPLVPTLPAEQDVCPLCNHGGSTGLTFEG